MKTLLILTTKYLCVKHCAAEFQEGVIKSKRKQSLIPEIVYYGLKF